MTEEKEQKKQRLKLKRDHLQIENPTVILKIQLRIPRLEQRTVFTIRKKSRQRVKNQ